MANQAEKARIEQQILLKKFTAGLWQQNKTKNGKEQASVSSKGVIFDDTWQNVANLLWVENEWNFVKISNSNAPKAVAQKH